MKTYGPPSQDTPIARIALHPRYTSNRILCGIGVQNFLYISAYFATSVVNVLFVGC